MGGIVAFVIGSIMLFDTDAPGFSVPLPLIGGAATASALALMGMLHFALKARRRPVVSGREHLIGAAGEVVEDGGGEFYARVHGEVWKVSSVRPLARGQAVRVTGIDGLVLAVEPEQKGE